MRPSAGPARGGRGGGVAGPRRAKGVRTGSSPGRGAPRPAPLTELHQRVEEAGDRHEEVDEKHVLQLQLHGRAAAGDRAGGVPPGRGVPQGQGSRPRRTACRPRPCSGSAPRPAFPALPSTSSRELGLGSRPAPTSGQSGTPPLSRVHFRSRRLVLGTAGVGDVTSGVRSAPRGCQKPVGARGRDFEAFPWNRRPCARVFSSPATHPAANAGPGVMDTQGWPVF